MYVYSGGVVWLLRDGVLELWICGVVGLRSRMSVEL